MKRVLSLVGLTTAAVGLMLSASANAAIISVTSGGIADPNSGQVSAFASVPGATTFNMNSNPGFTGRPVLFTTGNNSGQNAQPFGDTTQYASVGTLVTPATSFLTISGNNNYVGLYWGSVDAYNSLTVTDASGDHVVNSTLFSSVLAPAIGYQGPGGWL